MKNLLVHMFFVVAVCYAAANIFLPFGLWAISVVFCYWMIEEPLLQYIERKQ